MSRRILQGLREIAAHLGLHGQRTNRLVLSWIAREGLPARRLAGRWYAEVAELDAWWSSRDAANGIRASAGRAPELNASVQLPLLADRKKRSGR